MELNPSKKKASAPPEDEFEEGDKPVASVQRALLVLDAFLDAQATLTLSEIAARTGLYKSTILRLLATLEQQEYVVRTRSGEFHVGPKPLSLANRFQNAIQPEDVVLPVLRDLVVKTQESASYIVPQKGYRITLYRINSPLPIRDHGAAGDMVPLDRGAAGRVFMAFGDLSSRHQEIRERLIAVSQGEIHAGMTGMASPVFNGARECVGVVGLTGPDTRFTQAAIPALEKQLIAAARTLTLRLGGNGRLFESAGLGKETR
ncbi:MAG: IclR family transcriptional regulator [Burkholderiaceae bacterium]|nr:IclR family transcriptional regulator [Burkholderiaceae bacterium]MDP1968326.1 IclR family transcriptional regulator [Burkholderiaceae bacterium]